MEDPDDVQGNDTHIDSVNDAESSSADGDKETFPGDDKLEESVDITNAMKEIGKDIDPEHPEPLGE